MGGETQQDSLSLSPPSSSFPQFVPCSALHIPIFVAGSWEDGGLAREHAYHV